MTPEFLQHGVGDYRSDVFQFGLLLYRLCNENLLNDLFGSYRDIAALEADILAGVFPNRNAFNLHVPNALIKLVKTCLEVDPVNRYPDFYTVINELCNIVGYNLDIDLTNKEMSGTRDGKDYSIKYDLDSATNRYSVVFRVNGRRKAAFCKTHLTEYQLRNNIKKAIDGVS